ncbi:MAG: hypothetical protein GC181_03655 [Bacteroidetes bacterium]|nr:hypothetical protein [Bacteroidota bacterium]
MTKNKVKGAHIPPYAHVHGPVLDPTFYDNYIEILEGILKLAPPVPLVEFKVPVPNQDIIPFNELGAKVFATQTHLVQKDVKYGLEVIHSSKRRYLKKLLALLENGTLVLKEGRECIEDLIFLQDETAKRNNFRSNLPTIRKIISSLNENQYYCFVLYTKEGKPLSGAYCPHDNEFAYHLINASVNDDDNLLNKSNILTTYLAVSRAIDKGIGFDFEGSNISGIAGFYRMMGGVPTCFYRIEIAKNFIGKLYFALKYFF